jgi:hypothetical protein
MTDPAVPQRLAFEKRLAELERQVRDLQRTPILTSASVTGYVRVRDESGAEVVRMGELDPGEYGLRVSNGGAEVVRLGELDGGEYGIRILSPSGQIVFQVSDRGWRRPFFPVPMAYWGLRLETVSPSYIVLGYSTFMITSELLRWRVDADPGAGNTMDTRVRLVVFRGASPTFILGEWPDTIFNGHVGASDLEDIISPTVDPWGAEAALFFEARRTSGATAVGIRIPEHPYLFGT